MAKVLFVVYVPSTDEENNDADDVNQMNVGDDVSERNPVADESGIEDGTVVEDNTEHKVDESGILNGGKIQDNNTDPLNEISKENDEKKEVASPDNEEDKEGNTRHKAQNIFLKDLKKESNIEFPSKTDVDSESYNVKVEVVPESEIESEKKQPGSEKESEKKQPGSEKESEKKQPGSEKESEKKQPGSEKESEKKEPESEKESEKQLESEEKTVKERPAFVRFLSEKLKLIERVKRVLDDLNIKGIQWNLTEQNVYIGMFVACGGPQCEDILRKLSMLKIGLLKNSSVSIFPASISSEELHDEEDVEFEQEKRRVDELSEKVNRFKNSIKSRLVVDQVVNAVKSDAVFTFDFLMLVILASFVALMGLLESSSVVLVASMLISPLMGPILAGVFGVVIRKRDLIRVGIINEIRGLSLCVFIGFLIGFIPAGLEAGNSDWRSASEWPTPEMSSRGALRALPVGILIAVPSGAGVALSILGGKVGSLVGVAISASLLPPAVNAGLLWANAIVAAISPPSVLSTNASRSVVMDSVRNSLGCASLINNDYERQYFCNMAGESVTLGLISLLLTILNIVCIIIMGVIVLKIKEVAPIPHSFIPESESEFFCQDLRIARESNITMKGQAAIAIKKEWLKSYQEMKSQAGKEGDEEIDDEIELNEIIHEVEESPSVVKICDKMFIHSSKWSENLNVPASSYGEGRTFDFSKLSPRENVENGMSLRQRTPVTSDSYKTCQEEEDESHVYFTLHRYIPPMDILKGDSYSWKSGKFMKKLKMPKASRFAVSKVAERPEQKSSIPRVEENVTLATVHEMETQPLLSCKSDMAKGDTSVKA